MSDVENSLLYFIYLFLLLLNPFLTIRIFCFYVVGKLFAVELGY